MNLASPFLVVGLGNPGPAYSDTRHNLGFDVIDCLGSRWHIQKFKKKFRAVFAETTLGLEKALLLKPETYMNLSGKSVLEAIGFYRIEVADHFLVINDDLDLPAGKIRLRKAGGAGGHRGLLSIIEALGTENFYRLRIGVGRPEKESPKESHADFVLSKLKKNERELFRRAIGRASDAVEMIMEGGMDKAMNIFNKDRDEP